MIFRDGRVLLGCRRSAHGTGTWSFPGGHLEYGESWEDCARRETAEECGLALENIRFGAVTNDIFRDSGKHYVTIIMLADSPAGEPLLLEPDKLERWEWFDWDEAALPKPLFLPLSNLLERKYNPFA
jgi:8-oxo-dGTP diphosphatase